MNSHRRKFANPMGRNQHTARKWRWKGELKTTKEIAVQHDFPYQSLHKRLVVLGWPLEKALMTPLEPRPRKEALDRQEIPKDRITGLKMSFDL